MFNMPFSPLGSLNLMDLQSEINPIYIHVRSLACGITQIVFELNIHEKASKKTDKTTNLDWTDNYTHDTALLQLLLFR